MLALVGVLTAAAMAAEIEGWAGQKWGDQPAAGLSLVRSEGGVEYYRGDLGNLYDEVGRTTVEGELLYVDGRLFAASLVVAGRYAPAVQDAFDQACGAASPTFVGLRWDCGEVEATLRANPDGLPIMHAFIVYLPLREQVNAEDNEAVATPAPGPADDTVAPGPGDPGVDPEHAVAFRPPHAGVAPDDAAPGVPGLDTAHVLKDGTVVTTVDPRSLTIAPRPAITIAVAELRESAGGTCRVTVQAHNGGARAIETLQVGVRIPEGASQRDLTWGRLRPGQSRSTSFRTVPCETITTGLLLMPQVACVAADGGTCPAVGVAPGAFELRAAE